MTWTDPRDYTVDEVVTATILNTDHRDNLKAILHPYDYAPADVDVVSTATETSIYSKVITGGDLGANGLMRLVVASDILYNNSSADSLTLRVKFGGSSVLAAPETGFTSALRRVFHFEVFVANRGATNAQLVWLTGGSHTAFDATTGLGTMSILGGETTAYHALIQNTAAVDTTADQTLQLTAQWSASSANNSFRKRVAMLHLGQN